MILLNKFISITEKGKSEFVDEVTISFCNGKFIYVKDRYKIQKKYECIYAGWFGYGLSLYFTLPKFNKYMLLISRYDRIDKSVSIDYGLERLTIKLYDIHHLIDRCIEKYTKYYNFWKHIKL